MWKVKSRSSHWKMMSIEFNLKRNSENSFYDYPERWITWLVGRWRTQLIARQLVNCRTHEHRHFERTLRSTDTVPGPRLAEGRFCMYDQTALARRGEKYMRRENVGFGKVEMLELKIERKRDMVPRNVFTDVCVCIYIYSLTIVLSIKLLGVPFHHIYHLFFSNSRAKAI